MYNDMKEEIKSEVNIKGAEIGYLIEVKDQYIANQLAVTREELERIVLYGILILEDRE